MAPKYTISEEDRVVCLYYEGPATFEEWKESMDQIIHDKRFQPNFGFLIDQRAVPPPTVDFVQRVVGYLHFHAREFGGDYRSATVVADQASFGMARMIQGMSGSENIRVFRDVREAENWLHHAEEEGTELTGWTGAHRGGW